MTIEERAQRRLHVAAHHGYPLHGCPLCNVTPPVGGPSQFHQDLIEAAENRLGRMLTGPQIERLSLFNHTDDMAAIWHVVDRFGA